MNMEGAKRAENGVVSENQPVILPLKFFGESSKTLS